MTFFVESIQALPMLWARHPTRLAWPAVFLLLHFRIRRSAWLYVPFVLPGTLFHELNHLLLGWLLGARPYGMTLTPRRNGDALTLGSVSFGNLRWWNALPVAMAPLLLLPSSIWLITAAPDSPPLSLQNIGLAYLAAQCLIASKPSRSDFKLALRSLPSYGMLAALCYAASHWV
jgi:hypothetical protein